MWPSEVRHMYKQELGKRCSLKQHCDPWTEKSVRALNQLQGEETWPTFTVQCKISATILTWEISHARGCHHNAAACKSREPSTRELLFIELREALQEPTSGIIANPYGAHYKDTLLIRLAGHWRSVNNMNRSCVTKMLITHLKITFKNAKGMDTEEGYMRCIILKAKGKYRQAMYLLECNKHITTGLCQGLTSSNTKNNGEMDFSQFVWKGFSCVRQRFKILCFTLASTVLLWR